MRHFLLNLKFTNIYYGTVKLHILSFRYKHSCNVI